MGPSKNSSPIPGGNEGEVIRKARNRVGWSREALARELDVSAGWVFKVENGHSEIADEHIGRMKDVLPEAWETLTKLRIERLLGKLGIEEGDREDLEAAMKVEQSAALRRDLETIVRAANRQLERLTPPT